MVYSKSVKRTLTISVLLLFLGGCKATFVETYNNGTPYKAMARVVGERAIASREEGERYTYYSANNFTQEVANRRVLNHCKSQLVNLRLNYEFNPSYTCLISHEGNQEVWSRSLREYEEQKKIELMQSYVDLCISYGFTDKNAIATCLQREINNKKLLSATLKSKQETLDALKDIEKEVDDSWFDAILINEAIRRRKK